MIDFLYTFARFYFYGVIVFILLILFVILLVLVIRTIFSKYRYMSSIFPDSKFIRVTESLTAYINFQSITQTTKSLLKSTLALTIFAAIGVFVDQLNISLSYDLSYETTQFVWFVLTGLSIYLFYWEPHKEREVLLKTIFDLQYRSGKIEGNGEVSQGSKS